MAGDQCFAIVAGNGRGLVGHALVTLRPTIYFDGPLAVLDELYVQLALRGRSVGSALVNCLLQELALRGSLELHINVDEDDTATRRFYERHGFANNFPGSDWRMLLYYQELPPTRYPAAVAAGSYQPRSSHSGSEGRSAPSVVPSPWPGRITVSSGNRSKMREVTSA